MYISTGKYFLKTVRTSESELLHEYKLLVQNDSTGQQEQVPKSDVHSNVHAESVKLDLPSFLSFDDPKLSTATSSAFDKPFETINSKCVSLFPDIGKTAEDNIEANHNVNLFHSKPDLVTISVSETSTNRIFNSATVQVVSDGGNDESDEIKLKRKPSSFAKIKENIADFGETVTHAFKPVFKKGRFYGFWKKIELKIIEVRFLNPSFICGLISLIMFKCN